VVVRRVLVVGGGAREQAIAQAVDRAGAQVCAVLKNRNPGILRLARESKIVVETDAPGIAAHAKAWGVDLAVLGMDAAIEAGVADALQAVGIPCASPTRAAGEIEWSKSFMRNLLERQDIPGRIRWKSFREPSGIRSWIDELGGEVAVKPIGLTGGKGVRVTGDHLKGGAEAEAYAREILETGFGGSEVLIEEKLEGEEFSLQAFCDGTSATLMPAVQDHKRAFEGDKGPNTGGMGSYSDSDHSLPFLRADDLEAAGAIVRRIVRGLASVGRPYVGALYGQFMLTRDGVRIIEVNARFGDPEAMNVLELLESDYVEILHGMVDGRLAPTKVQFRREATVCKYVVPEGYGTRPLANEPLFVDEAGIRAAGAAPYYAAVNETPEGLRTTTSRAVGLVARAPSIGEANDAVEKALAFVRGPHLFVRHDIGTRGLIERRVAHAHALRRA
jgi:phosphoribosylamine--glycine ligase